MLYNVFTLKNCYYTQHRQMYITVILTRLMIHLGGGQKATVEDDPPEPDYQPWKEPTLLGST